MLFDNDNLDLDLAILNLAGINNNMMNNNYTNNSNVLNAKEGLLRGNMFKNEYVPYKGKTFLNVEPSNEREKKLFKIMAYSFAANDLNLYLDLHPDDSNMLNLFKNFEIEEKKAKEEYESIYGPLEVCNVKGNTFNWINSPWPWNEEGGIKYV